MRRVGHAITVLFVALQVLILPCHLHAHVHDSDLSGPVHHHHHHHHHHDDGSVTDHGDVVRDGPALHSDDHCRGHEHAHGDREHSTLTVPSTDRPTPRGTSTTTPPSKAVQTPVAEAPATDSVERSSDAFSEVRRRLVHSPTTAPRAPPSS